MRWLCGRQLLRDGWTVYGDGPVLGGIVLGCISGRVHDVRSWELPERERCERLPELSRRDVRNADGPVGVFELRGLPCGNVLGDG